MQVAVAECDVVECEKVKMRGRCRQRGISQFGQIPRLPSRQ